MNIPNSTLVALATLSLAFFASPSWAETTIKVVETGEGGGSMGLKLDPMTVKAGATTSISVSAAGASWHLGEGVWDADGRS